MKEQHEFKIVLGNEVGISEICQGFNLGFSDYKYSTSFDPIGMQRFLERSGIEIADCAVMLAHWDDRWRPVGVALLAIEGDESWCGGLAVAPDFRRRRGAERLMHTIQAQARRRGAARLRLEVLAENEPARALYRRLGYVETRELLMWERSTRQGHLPAPFERLHRANPAQIISDLHHWHDLPPAWQRRAPYLRRAHSLMDGDVILAKDALPVAYVLYHHNLRGRNGRETVHIFDIAVDPCADVSEAGHPLIQALQLSYMNADLFLLNEPADSKLNRIFAALGFYVVDRQYELIRELGEE
ncbi:MAG: GNAT family N-acetyltransferase [Caldilineaceae bacterium]|nr:GNAT family N-acetyltransferase [Caldilineaceae bacterium]